MSNTVTLQNTEYQDLLKRMSHIEDMLSFVVKKIEESPRYGSDEWWNQELQDGDTEIAQGSYKTFSSAQELIQELHQGL